jgi:hypothetical protein
MSKTNIVNRSRTKGGIIVTFKTKSGEFLSYRYEGHAAVAILQGADPAAFSGERVSNPAGGFGDVMDWGELAGNAAEILGSL